MAAVQESDSDENILEEELSTCDTDGADFMLCCEWEGCEDEFDLQSNGKYLYHVQDHIHQHVELLALKAIRRLSCMWRGCARRIETFNEMEFARHVLYHPYHQKIKVNGLLTLKSEKIFVPCQFDPTYRNMVPDFPEEIMCHWDSCKFKCNCITAFDDHMKLHIQDATKLVPHKRSKRKIIDFACKWRGCRDTTTIYGRTRIRYHMQKHTNIRDYACAGCGALFCSKFNFLDHHRRQATPDSGFIIGDVLFQCSHCLKKYPTESILKNHMRCHIHNHLCNYCQETFVSSSCLKKHIVYRHSKERMFPCVQCEYKARDQYDLSKHCERLHSSREAFKCTVDGCKYECLNEDTFKIHTRTKHSSNPKNYACHLCDKRFTDGRILSRHLTVVHHFKRPPGSSKFKYIYHRDGCYRLQTVKYESNRLVAIKKLRDKAEASLLELGVTPDTDMDIVIKTDTGEEQQVKFVPYKNALLELNEGSVLEEDDSNALP